jgi:hypothetical protein
VNILCAPVYFVHSLKLMERPSTCYCSAATGTVQGVKARDIFGSLSDIVLMVGGSQFVVYKFVFSRFHC